MAESRNRSLTTLPLLVIVSVAEALCPHCPGDSEFSSWQTPTHLSGLSSCDDGPRMSNSRALANLAATCKDMHAIVTPILYHHVPCDPEQRVSLLRTLAARPDLARHVKVLGLDVGGCGAELKGEDDEAFVMELAARHGWAPPPPPTVGTESRVAQDERTGRSRAERDFPMNLLMALCPNLEKFSADLDYFCKFDLLQPASLPHLKNVYVAHGDTEYGTNLDALGGLYLAAPAMETFTSRMTDHVGDTILPLGNLRHVCLPWSAISAGCLRTLLKSCPQLESFEYGAGGACVGFEQFSIAQMMRLLVCHVPRLKRLVFSFDHDAEFNDSDDDDVEDDEEDVEPAPGFASLSHLETLAVDPETVAVWAEQQPVATLFPQSLRSLTVTTYHLPIELGGMDLKEFARTSRTFLPNLASVASLYNGDRLEYLLDSKTS